MKQFWLLHALTLITIIQCSLLENDSSLLLQKREPDPKKGLRGKGSPQGASQSSSPTPGNARQGSPSPRISDAEEAEETRQRNDAKRPRSATVGSAGSGGAKKAARHKIPVQRGLSFVTSTETLQALQTPQRIDKTADTATQPQMSTRLSSELQQMRQALGRWKTGQGASQMPLFPPASTQTRARENVPGLNLWAPGAPYSSQALSMHLPGVNDAPGLFPWASGTPNPLHADLQQPTISKDELTRMLQPGEPVKASQDVMGQSQKPSLPGSLNSQRPNVEKDTSKRGQQWKTPESKSSHPKAITSPYSLSDIAAQSPRLDLSTGPAVSLSMAGQQRNQPDLTASSPYLVGPPPSGLPMGPLSDLSMGLLSRPPKGSPGEGLVLPPASERSNLSGFRQMGEDFARIHGGMKGFVQQGRASAGLPRQREDDTRSESSEEKPSKQPRLQ